MRVARRSIHAVCAAILVCSVMTHAAARPDRGGIDAPEEARAFVYERLKDDQLGTLGAVADEYRTTHARFDDGRSKLMMLYRAFQEIGQLAAEGEVASFRTALEHWVASLPGSPTPVVATAQLIVGQAWSARGKKLAGETPASSMDRFRKRLEEARALLDAHREVGARCPGWHTARLDIAQLLGADEPTRTRIFDEGVAFDPSYSMLYLTYANGLTPRWGGSYDAIRRFAARAAELSKATDGSSMYARVYWVALAVERDAVFTEAGVDWSRLRESFLDLERRTNGSIRNLNAFAKFACGLRDRDTAGRLVRKIGNDWTQDIWWRAENYEQCRSWAEAK